MIRVKTEEELQRMRVSNRMAASVRDRIADKIAPGVSTAEIDLYANELIEKEGGVSAFKGYRGFPGHICISVNDEVVHGIGRQDRIIQMGDIVSVDVGVRFDGFIGDTARTIMVGVTDPEVIQLVETTRLALYAGIEAAVDGNRVGDISHAIEQAAEGSGFSIVREFVGHGVGHELHEDPQVPNFGKPGKGPRLKTGMTLAIEPMLNMGTAKVEILSDGWTVLTRDRKPSAHFEHTVAIMPEKAEILSMPIF
jgi:methionyl aminopeptidase